MDLLLPNTFTLNGHDSPPTELRIEDVLDAIETEYDKWPYDVYDGYSIDTDNSLRDLDILIAHNAQATGGGQASWRFFKTISVEPTRSRIESALARLPTTPSVHSPQTIDSTAQAMQTLFETLPLGEGKGVGPAVATKILHKKRPHLIPIMDSFLWTTYGMANWRKYKTNNHKRMISLWRWFMADLHAVMSSIESLCQALVERRGYAITPLRAFDFCIWLAGKNYVQVSGFPGDLLRRMPDG